jgi:hypothetical protein
MVSFYNPFPQFSGIELLLNSCNALDSYQGSYVKITTLHMNNQGDLNVTTTQVFISFYLPNLTRLA